MYVIFTLSNWPDGKHHPITSAPRYSPNNWGHIFHRLRPKNVPPGWVIVHPCPDTLPVIDQSPLHANVIYAFGHGHVGVTQAVITGKLVSQVVAGVVTEIDLKPFSISRYARSSLKV